MIGRKREIERKRKEKHENLLNFPKVYSHRKIHFHSNLPHCKLIDQKSVENIRRTNVCVCVRACG